MDPAPHLVAVLEDDSARHERGEPVEQRLTRFDLILRLGADKQENLQKSITKPTERSHK